MVAQAWAATSTEKEMTFSIPKLCQLNMPYTKTLLVTLRRRAKKVKFPNITYLAACGVDIYTYSSKVFNKFLTLQLFANSCAMTLPPKPLTQSNNRSLTDELRQYKNHYNCPVYPSGFD
jgi:hypothetical protein